MPTAARAQPASLPFAPPRAQHLGFSTGIQDCNSLAADLPTLATAQVSGADFARAAAVSAFLQQ
eukprot:1119896-Rhodomonas_salina.1